MPAYEKLKLTFIHIPKAAGSSIQMMFENAGLQAIDQTRGHKSLNEIIDAAPHTSSYTSFAVIRDPIERIYSGWKNAQRNALQYQHYLTPKQAIKYAENNDIDSLFGWPQGDFLKHQRWKHKHVSVFNLPFNDFVLHPVFNDVFSCQVMFKPSTRWLSVLPSYGIHFEDLKGGLNRLNLSIPLKYFGHENKSSNNFKPVKEIINQKATAKLKEMYASEYEVNSFVNMV